METGRGGGLREGRAGFLSTGVSEEEDGDHPAVPAPAEGDGDRPRLGLQVRGGGEGGRAFSARRRPTPVHQSGRGGVRRSCGTAAGPAGSAARWVPDSAAPRRSASSRDPGPAPAAAPASTQLWLTKRSGTRRGRALELGRTLGHHHQQQQQLAIRGASTAENRFSSGRL